MLEDELGRELHLIVQFVLNLVVVLEEFSLIVAELWRKGWNVLRVASHDR